MTAVLLLLLRWPALFPESARWLLATYQLEKGRSVLRSLAEGNGVYLEEDFYTAEHLLAREDGEGLAPFCGCWGGNAGLGGLSLACLFALGGGWPSVPSFPFQTGMSSWRLKVASRRRLTG